MALRFTNNRRPVWQKKFKQKKAALKTKAKTKKLNKLEFKTEHERLTFWARQIRAWRKSGMSRKDFAREKGFSVNTFDHYRYKLALDKEIKPREPFVGEKEDVLVVGRIAATSEKSYIKSSNFEKLSIDDLSPSNQKLVDQYIKYLELGGRSVSTVKFCPVPMYFDETLSSYKSSYLQQLFHFSSTKLVLLTS